MTDLITFLKARLDHEQARLDLLEPGHTLACSSVYDRDKPVTRDEQDAECTCRRRYLLADIEAKRRIIDLHPGDFPYDPDGVTSSYSWTEFCTHCGNETPCPTLRLLALPYSTHPDYQEDWKP